MQRFAELSAAVLHLQQQAERTQQVEIELSRTKAKLVITHYFQFCKAQHIAQRTQHMLCADCVLPSACTFRDHDIEHTQSVATIYLPEMSPLMAQTGRCVIWPPMVI